MPTFELEKLVRDELPRMYEEEGQIPEMRILEQPAERQEALLQKLEEELAELDDEGLSRTERINELADVQEVLKCLADEQADDERIPQAENILESVLEEFAISPEEVRLAQEKKVAKAGSFKYGQWVVNLTVEETSPWTRYYRDKGYRELP